MMAVVLNVDKTLLLLSVKVNVNVLGPGVAVKLMVHEVLVHAVAG